MPTIEFTPNNPPSLSQLRQFFQDVDQTGEPVEELLRLERELIRLEAEHGLTSSEFLAQYDAGELGDSMAFVAWAGRYRLYLQLRQAITDGLQVVVASNP
jgi:hypothetical protein